MKIRGLVLYLVGLEKVSSVKGVHRGDDALTHQMPMPMQLQNRFENTF